MSNIVTAKFCSDQTRAWTDELWQYDYGQILKFDGLELPDAYEVHFSNQPLTGETITQIGTADGVTIPDQFLQSGEVVYAWVYLHAGEDDGETEYMVTIPVSKRPEPSDEQPTPVEQSAIDQAIAALNIAVEKADEAITHYPKIQSGTWWVWDVTAEEYVDTGVEAKGDPGDPGTPGNGIVSIIKTGTSGLVDTYTITYTNGQTTTFTVTNGSDATVTVDDALSDTSTNPVQNKVIKEEVDGLIDDINQLSESIAPVESTTTATAAHAVGELFMMGETLMVALSAIAIGDTITTEGGSPNAAVTTLSGEMIKDVQINGTSITTDGVANIPLMSVTRVGVAKVKNVGGTAFDYGDNSIIIYKAADSIVKAGSNIYMPIVPYSQHMATFYGLAKAASDTTQSSSSNPVGTYTDDAKDKIQKMLGLNQEAELIYSATVAEDSTSITIETDSNGLPFAIKAAKIQLKMTASTTGNADYISVQYMATLANGTSTNWLDWPTVRMNSATGCLNVYEFESIGGLYFLRASTAMDYGGSSGNMTTMNMDFLIKSINKIKILRYSSTMTSIPAGTVIKIYGVRA